MNPEIENLKKSVKNTLKEEQNINKKGVEHLELFEFEEALECFDKAAEINPNLTASMQFKKGLIYKEINDYFIY